MKFFRVSVYAANMALHASTVVRAEDAASARKAGLKQIGVLDPPPPGCPPIPRVEVGEVGKNDFIASESARLGIRREDVQAPE